MPLLSFGFCYFAWVKERIIRKSIFFILTQSSKTKPHVHEQKNFYNSLPYIQEYYQEGSFRIFILIYNQLELFMMKMLNVLQNVLHQVNPQQINKKFQVLSVQASNSNCPTQQPMHRPKRTPHRYRTHAIIFVLILPIEKIDFRGDYALSTALIFGFIHFLAIKLTSPTPTKTPPTLVRAFNHTV